MATKNRAETLHNELAKNLITLKRNREKVSLEILKTKYASGYNSLCTSSKCFKRRRSSQSKLKMLCFLKV